MRRCSSLIRSYRTAKPSDSDSTDLVRADGGLLTGIRTGVARRWVQSGRMVGCCKVRSVMFAW